MANLHPETLRSLLQAGADHAERRRFALTASEVLAVDAVVEVVEAAAVTTGQTISSHLLRLLHKFAHHAERTTGPARAEAESVLRDERRPADRGLGARRSQSRPSTPPSSKGWCRYAAADAGRRGANTTSCEAGAVLQIALETGCTGPRVFAALDGLLDEGRFGRVAALLADAPTSGVGRAPSGATSRPRPGSGPSWRPSPWTSPRWKAWRSGWARTAADPLLDYLETAEDQTSRARALKVLIGIGPRRPLAAAARFAQAPWYVQRNILVLLRALHAWPEGFSPISCTLHPTPRVRREAYKLLLEHPQHRTSALSHGLNDADDGIVQSGPARRARILSRGVGQGGRAIPGRTSPLTGAAGAGRPGPGARDRGGGASPAGRARRRAAHLPGLAAGAQVPDRARRARTRSPSTGPPTRRRRVCSRLARDHPDPDFRLAAEARFA